MAERTVLVLNGGGALGAYQCGIYRALVRGLSIEQRRSMIIVGASIGAINGLIIAAHSGQDDGGAAVLERFWRSVALPSVPFVPVPHPYWNRVNATLTGALFGNPAIFYAVPGGLLGGLFAYPYVAAYSNESLLVTLGRITKGYSSRAAGPRLLVRAIDVMAAAPAWFDSARERVVPAMAVGSSAIPLLFKPVWHNGRALWDGDIWPQGVLPEALERLGREAPDDTYHVITAELFSAGRQFPFGFGANVHQLRTMFFGARSDQDAAAGLLQREGNRITRIRRAAHPYEQASAELMDWAPERIEALIAQGQTDAERALADAETSALRVPPRRQEGRGSG